MDTKLLGLILQGDKKNEREFNRIKETYEELSKSKANTITSSANGESIVLSDSSDSKLDSLRVMGKTEQFTTTGAQLANLPDVESYTVNGITFSCKGGVVTAKGTSTADASSRPSGIWHDMTGEVGTFCVSQVIEGTINGSIIVYVRIIRASGNEEYPSRGASFTLDGTETGAYFYIQASPNATMDVTIYPMLNKGSTALPWEPYTGGIPSPNPQYPQEIVSAGDDGGIEVGVYGGNLFDVSSMRIETNVSLDIDDDDYTITAIGGSNNTYSKSRTKVAVECLLGKTVYLYADSIEGNDSRNQRVQVEITTKSGMKKYYSISANGLVSSFKVPKDTVSMYVDVYTNNTNTLFESDITTVVKGLRLTLTPNAEWTPYHKQPLTIPTPNGLPGIKVTDPSIATYTDEAGQMWCADEVDFEREVYVKRVKEVVFDGSDDEGWYVKNLSNDIKVFVHPQLDVYSSILPPRHGAMSNVGYVHYINLDNGGYGLCYAYGVRICFENMNPDNNTLDELRAYLVENPITFIYPLATPIETPLSESELEAYKSLHTNHPTTTILNDSGAHMEVKYTADKKNYIDNKFAQITNAVLSMGSNI